MRRAGPVAFNYMAGPVKGLAGFHVIILVFYEPPVIRA